MGHPVDVASGTLFHSFEDFTIPGRIPLILGRRYSSALAGQGSGMFGPGWTSPLEMRLRWDLEGYRVLSADGESEIPFNDPADTVAAGATVRNLGSFHELRQQMGYYFVTRWDPDSEDITQYVFQKGGPEEWWPLKSVMDITGQGLDIQRDQSGRICLVRQRREGRALRLTYDDHSGRLVRVHALAPLFALKDGEGDPADSSQYEERLVLHYGYGQEGLLREVTDALGQRCQYSYDGAGRMTGEINIGGMEYSFRYDSQGRCVETSGKNGHGRNLLEILDPGKVTIVTDALGAKTVYEWNDIGQVEQEISPLGHKTVTEYDQHGRIVAEVSAKGAMRAYAFDEQGDRVKITAPGGAETAYQYNNHHQVLAVKDPAGHQWKSTIDHQGRITAIENPQGGSMAMEYNQYGDLSGLKDSSGNRCSLEWDWAGNMVCARDWQGNTTRFEFSPLGHVTAVVEDGGSRSSARLDLLGRVRELHQPDGSHCSFLWDAYDQVLRDTDEAGEVTTYRYEACGQIAETVDPGGGRTCFAWSPIPGQLLAVTNARGESHRIQYDADGNAIKETDFAGRTTCYEYDPDGQVIAETDPAGQRTEYVRDPDGEVTEILYPDGSSTTLTYDERGLLKGADNGQVEVEREYDSCCNLVRERQGEHEVESSFDLLGNRVGRKSSLGYETAYSYNANRRLQTLTAGSCSPILFSYDRMQEEVARLVQGGVQISQKHDHRALRSEQRVEDVSGRAGANGQPIIKRDYSYDALGNMIEVRDQHWGRSLYGYDVDSHVTKAQLPGKPPEGYVYDGTHNVEAAGRLSKTMAGGEPDFIHLPCAYEPGNLLVQFSDTHLHYDDLGRLIRKEGGQEAEFAWNNASQLITFAPAGGDQWEYLYDAFGRRIKKIGPHRAVEYLWDEDVVLHEIDVRGSGTDDVVRSVVHWEFDPDGFEPIAKVQDGQLYLCVNDVVGNPRELVTPEGIIVWSAQFSNFGLLEDRGTWDVDCPVRYLGQWYDDESGLHYNRHRYYDPSVGRFISSDPVGLLGGLNSFAYGLNTTGWVDPLGLTGACALGPKKYKPGDDIPPGHTVVTRWGRPGLRGGDWVMTGKMSRLKYFLSFKWQPKWLPGKNIPAKYRSGEMFVVPKSRVKLPKERLLGVPTGWIKLLFAQRQYI